MRDGNPGTGTLRQAEVQNAGGRVQWRRAHPGDEPAATPDGEANPPLRSEFKSRTHLDIARAGNGTIPFSEVSAGHVVGEGLAAASAAVAGGIEDMPVPQVEELRADLEVQPLGDLRVLDERERVVLIGPVPESRDASPAARIEVEARNVIARFEGADVEQRGTFIALSRGAASAGIKAALALSEGVCPWQDSGDATFRKLTWHVALVGSEEERCAGGHAKDVAHLPASESFAKDSAPVGETLAWPEGQVVDVRQ